MSRPVVSVIMAACNAANTIAEAIDSILRQTWKDLELIVLDDGSTDATASVVNGFHDPRIRLISNESNMGLARSLRRGSDAATGRFVARMDADDLSHAQRLERQIAFLEGRPRVGFAGTSFDLMDEQSRVFGRRVRPATDEFLQRQLLVWNPFCHGSVMIRTELLRAAGGYDENFPSAMDFDLWLRLAEQTRAAIMPEVLYSWRVGPDSMTHAHRARQDTFARRALELAWQRRVTGADALGRVLPVHFTDSAMPAEHCAIWAREALRQRRSGAAARLLARSLALDPFNVRLRAGLRRAPAACLRAVKRCLTRDLGEERTEGIEKKEERSFSQTPEGWPRVG